LTLTTHKSHPQSATS